MKKNGVDELEEKAICRKRGLQSLWGSRKGE